MIVIIQYEGFNNHIQFIKFSSYFIVYKKEDNASIGLNGFINHKTLSTVKCTQEKKVVKTLLVYICNKVIWVVVNYSQAVDS